jgi:hypothetical protein
LFRLDVNTPSNLFVITLLRGEPEIILGIGAGVKPLVTRSAEFPA